MGVFDKVKAAAGAVANKAGDILNYGIDKVKAVMDEIAATSPYLQEVGYRVTDLELEVAISPKVIVHLVREAEVSEEAFEASLATHAESKTFCTLVKLLRQANHIQAKIQPKDRIFKGLEVCLGIPPSFRMKYVERGDVADPAAPAG
jgi:hypothetical protein